jgi:nucleotide-binding universal stress UspA family protein
MLRIETILHPTDFSPHSEHAFHVACSLARDHGGRVIVLHVAVPPVVGHGGAITPPPEGDWKALEMQLALVRPSDGKISVEHRLDEGNPASEILRVAEESQCNLIVMGTHGRSGVARLLMGSVAEHVVRRATCSVLVVKAPFSEIPAT